MSTKQLSRTLILQQPHSYWSVPQTNPSAGNVEDVVLSSRAICCSVAKQLQEERTPTPFQSERQMVGDIGKPIKLAPTNDSICDSIAVER